MEYDAVAAPYAEHRAADPAVLDALVAGVSRASRVLEVGCGTGDYIVAIRERTGARCAGVDPSREMLAHARERSAGVELRAGTGEALPFAAASFDLVFAIDVVHHLGDYASALVEARRTLRSGGRICIGTEDEAMLRARIHGRYFPETLEAELRRYPCASDLAAAMTAAGFVDVHEQRTSTPTRVTDSRAYRAKAFSSLHLLSAEAFERGLERMESDLARGPIEGARQHLLVWAAAT